MQVATTSRVRTDSASDSGGVKSRSVAPPTSTSGDASRLWSAWRDTFASSVAVVSQAAFQCGAQVPMVLWTGNHAFSRRLIVAFALTSYVGNVLKNLFCMPRPPRRFVHPSAVKQSDASYAWPSQYGIMAASLPVFISAFLTPEDWAWTTGTWTCALHTTVLVGWVTCGAIARVYYGLTAFEDMVAGGFVGFFAARAWLPFTVTLRANPANDLTCPPPHILQFKTTRRAGAWLPFSRVVDAWVVGQHPLVGAALPFAALLLVLLHPNPSVSKKSRASAPFIESLSVLGHAAGYTAGAWLRGGGVAMLRLPRLVPASVGSLSPLVLDVVCGLQQALVALLLVFFANQVGVLCMVLCRVDPLTCHCIQYYSTHNLTCSPSSLPYFLLREPVRDARSRNRVQEDGGSGAHWHSSRAGDYAEHDRRRHWCRDRARCAERRWRRREGRRVLTERQGRKRVRGIRAVYHIYVITLAAMLRALLAGGDADVPPFPPASAAAA